MTEKGNELYLKLITLDELHEILLEMLGAFDLFCSTHKLTYFLDGGTLLGAVRHKGFIPWDDDVDILMPRPDYEKLRTYKQIAPKMDVLSFDNRQYNIQYMNISNSNTIIVEPGMRKDIGRGVYIDIFPLDGIPTDKKTRKQHDRATRFIMTLLSVRIHNSRKIPWDRKLLREFLYVITKPISAKFLLRKIDMLGKKYAYETAEHVFKVIFHDGSIMDRNYKKTYFDEIINCEFEDIELKIAKDYDALLRMLYKDYMKLPPPEKRVGNHEFQAYWKST